MAKKTYQKPVVTINIGYRGLPGSSKSGMSSCKVTFK